MLRTEMNKTNTHNGERNPKVWPAEMRSHWPLRTFLRIVKKEVEDFTSLFFRIRVTFFEYSEIATTAFRDILLYTGQVSDLFKEFHQFRVIG